MVDEAVNKFGKVTIAVANAGITLFGDFFDYKPEALQNVVSLNIGGSFFLYAGSSQANKKTVAEVFY